MTIQDLGSLGELIAAIATVATLAYLAVQIRQNTRSLKGSTDQSLMNLEVDTFALIAQHANIYERGRANIADLDAEEKVVFDQLVSAVVSHLYSGFAQYQAGISSESDWKTYLTDWRTTYIKHPGFQSGWAEVRKSYPEDFCKCLDEVGKFAEDAN